LSRSIYRTFLLIAVGAMALFLAVAAWYWTTPGPGTGDGRSSGRALIGGSFTLVDQAGRTVTDEDFRGRYMLIYFGYTFCPDVCPLALQSMSTALDMLGQKADAVVPLFITIDPERDTVPVLADYSQHFHPSLRALTGTAEQVRGAARAYRVYYKKAEDGGTFTDYLMDHTSLVYLMGPDGEYLAHFTHGTTVEEIARRLSEILG
jgi:cytochrome oxidase Cu insertion factor (SCO1/SenC/PrrC family)